MSKKRAARPRRVPQRTCIACRETNDKRALVRLVRTPADGIAIDPTGKQPGRGAYLHLSPTCWEKAANKDWAVVARSLKTTLSAADRERLTAFAANQLAEEGV